VSNHSNGNGGGLSTNVGSVLANVLGATVPEVNLVEPDTKVCFGPSCPDRRRPFRNDTHDRGFGEHGPRWDRPDNRQGTQRSQYVPVSEVFGSVALDSVDRIELKLTFHEDAHCDLIPQQLRLDTTKIDKKKVLGSQYVDRGTQPIKSNHTQASLIRVGLANNGFYLADARSYRKHEPDRVLKYYNRPKRCVVLEFRRNIDGAIPLDSVTQDEVRALANLSWAECFVWDNTQVEPLPGHKPDRSVTINCRGPERDMKPKRMLAIRDGSIVSVPAVVES
jgi:hypothetical protein